MKADRSKSTLTATYALLTVAFLTMIGINIYAYQTVTNLSDMYSNLNNAAMNFKLKVMNANLLFREISSGYSNKDMNEVWSLIDEAKKYAEGINSIDSESKLLENVTEYRQIVLDCYKAKNIEKPNPELRKKYDKSFGIMLQKVDSFGVSIKDKIAIKMGLVKLLYVALIVNILLLFGFIMFMLWRYASIRKRAEDELIATHSDLENLLNTLDSMLITVDQKGVILQWNNKAERYFSKPAAVMVGRVLYNVLPCFKPYQSQVETVYVSRKSKEHFREKIMPDSNRERVFNIILTPVTQGGKGVSGVLVRADDVTEQELRDEQVRQSQKMQVVENLIGGLAHDFNNVLGAITGTISMMRFSLDNKSSLEDVKGNVELIESSAERAVVMVQQMLMMVQKHKAEMTPLDLNSSIMHVLRICQNTFDRRINIEASLYDVKAIAKADPVQMALVLLNLCDNAAQAMTSMRKEDAEQGGTLSIAIDRLVPDKTFRASHLMATEHSYWVISVQDSGVGMEKDIVSKIFDPFFTTKRPGEGTGLGLTMVSETVRSHSGFIEVSSEPGKGSLFKIYLPEFAAPEHESQRMQKQVQSDAPQPPKPSAENGIPIGSGLILVVDDEAIMRKTAKNILEKLGYQVIVAEDGDDGVKAFVERKSEVKAVLLDMSMPKMSGKDAYVEMKKADPNVKALLVSGFKKDERIDAALALGINGFVQKPYTMQVLAQEVKKLVGDGPGTGEVPLPK